MTHNTDPATVRALVEARQIALNHAQRCRDVISQCKAWSPVQGEWSRARDVAMDIADEIEGIALALAKAVQS